MAFLEREAARAQRLDERVRELEAENRELRAALANVAAPSIDMEPESTTIYLAAALEGYIQLIIDATRDRGLAHLIAAGALPIDALRIADAARLRARGAQRNHVRPEDVQAAAREVLASRIIVREGAPSALELVDELVAMIPPP